MHQLKKNILNLLKSQLRQHGGKDYVRYILTGSFNTLLSFLLYSGGILLGLGYVKANAIAWFISVMISYLLNSRFVFRKSHHYRRFLIFILSNVFSLLISMSLLSLLITVFFVNSIVASIITIPIVVALNYLAAKFIVFN